MSKISEVEIDFKGRYTDEDEGWTTKESIEEKLELLRWKLNAVIKVVNDIYEND